MPHNFPEDGAIRTQQHIEAAQEFLEASDREFADGDVVQGSEKMWGAASHFVMVAAQHRGWEFGDHRSLKAAVQRLAQESGDESLSGDFIAADHFHADLYHKFMQDYEIDDDRLMVRRFVEQMQALVG